MFRFVELGCFSRLCTGRHDAERAAGRARAQRIRAQPLAEPRAKLLHGFHFGRGVQWRGFSTELQLCFLTVFSIVVLAQKTAKVVSTSASGGMTRSEPAELAPSEAAPSPRLTQLENKESMGLMWPFPSHLMAF